MSPQNAPFRSILCIRRTAEDLDRLVRFYGEGLGAKFTGAKAISPEEMTLLGLAESGVRAGLAFGDQILELEGFDRKGRPFTAGDAADLNFQHLALVVKDVQAAFARALDHGAVAISRTGPVRLPLASGGATAVKFRDPEGHPLELISFRDGECGPFGKKLDGAASGVVVGVDHTAISVSRLGASLAFYQERGLRLTGRTLNVGPAQGDLDGLDRPEVDVAALAPAVAPPHLELLAYQRPEGRPVAGTMINDAGSTRVVWASDRDGLAMDPDGHRHQTVAAEPGSPSGDDL